MNIDKLMQKKFQVKKRFVEEEDASFILSLRLNKKRSRFLSATLNDLELQKKWIREYKEREKKGEEFYFIFESSVNVRYGVSRIYNIESTSFEIGSWLFAENSPEGLSILADLCTREFAFSNNSFEYCRFEVRKMNKSVVGYHKRFKPELVGEDELNYYFKLPREQFEKYKSILIKIYSNGIE